MYGTAPETRQYRHLVKYCKVVVGHIHQVQNIIRTMFANQALRLRQKHGSGQCKMPGSDFKVR